MWSVFLMTFMSGLLRGQETDIMNKTGYLQGCRENLFYNYSKPAGQVKVGIIFVHAASGNRLGPHRMFVEMGEEFYRLGYATMRFDFAGCGDSTGTGPMQSIEDDSFDLARVCEFFKQKGALEKIFLIGISRGSRLCFNAMRKYKIDMNGMVLFSASYLDNSVFVRLFANRLKQYFIKLVEPGAFKRLISGAVNFKGIFRTFAFCFQFKQKAESAKGRSGFKTICPLLFVYGKNDPITNNSKIYYSQICKKTQIDYKCVLIENANHSFFHYKWKEQLFEISKKWIEGLAKKG